MNKKQKGFTLIEVLIVIAMIAVLSTIVLIGLGPSRKIGRDARRVADLRQVQSGLELYFSKCGYYPGTAQVGATCGAFSAINAWSDLQAALTGSGVGISQVPDDPNSSSGSHYVYAANANGTSYVLATTLEDLNNPSLKESAQGNLYGVSCGASSPSGSTYCLQL